MFWEYHDYIFEQSGVPLNQGNLKGFANALGMDMVAFSDCFDSRRYSQLVQEDTGWAQGLGVSSTPTFLANGYAVIGAQPFESFQQIFLQELEQ
jgi:predicted DsbA family dithiol-disulfide isomerase